MSSPVVTRTRDLSLDFWRGIAMLVMLADHLLIVSGNETSPLRYLTRVSMPLFFVIGGVLARRNPNWERLAVVFLLGIGIGHYVEWIDAPNVLCIYAVGAIVIGRYRASHRIMAIIATAGLTLFANGYWHVDGYYNPAALLGLMAIGAMVGKEFFFVRKPLTPLAKFGRYPLSFYVGHILVLALTVRIG